MNIVFLDAPKDYAAKLKVIQCIDAPLETITVSEICARCGVSRKWFYRHFDSKYDILYWFLGFCFSRSLFQIGRTKTWREGICALLALLEEGRGMILADYMSLSSKRATYYWPLNSLRITEMKRTLVEYRKVEIDKGLELEIALYSSLVPNLIRFYLQADGEVSKEQYALIWRDSVPQRLCEALELDG